MLALRGSIHPFYYGLEAPAEDGVEVCSYEAS